MEYFFFLIIGLIALALLFDIRLRLPKPSDHSEMTYGPSTFEGFDLLVRQVHLGNFRVGFDGNWSTGLYFDLHGDVIPFHEEYREKQKLEFSGRQSIRIHPIRGPIESTRLGNVYMKGQGGSTPKVHLFLPADLHQQLLAQFQENSEWVVEIGIGKDKKKARGEETHGVYSLEVRRADYSDFERLGEKST